MKRLLLCCLIISSSYSMEVSVRSQLLTYKDLKAGLDRFQLLKVREITQLPSKEIARNAYRLIMYLKDQGSISEDDSVFLSECIKGRTVLKIEPSTVMVRDLGVYYAALCSHDDLAQKLYCSYISFDNDRYDQFISKLFFVGIVRDCPVLAECILRRAISYYNKKKATTEFFAQLVPVLFYRDDRELLIRMGDALGADYLSGSCQRMVLAAFDNDVIGLRGLVAENDFSYDSILKFILIGCCIKPKSNGLETVEYSWTLLLKATPNEGRETREKFREMLCCKAKDAGNTAIAEYLA